jgi:hypothetical protein
MNKPYGFMELGIEFMMRFMDSPYILSKDTTGEMHIIYAPKNEDGNE